MEIRLIRKWFTQNSTVGELLIGGQEPFCYVLEDVVRPPGMKIPGQTAIPEGRYEIVIDFSKRFQREMPHILDVPNFSGIRIHAGNESHETEGCLLLGKKRSVDFVGQSKAARDEFQMWLSKTLETEPVYITIEGEHNA